MRMFASISFVIGLSLKFSIGRLRFETILIIQRYQKDLASVGT